MPLLLALLALPSSAWASACCFSAGAYGLGRLAMYERASVTFDVGGGRSAAYWDGSGALHDISAADATTSASAKLGVMLRLSERSSLWLRTPWALTARSGEVAGERVHRFGQGLGDADLGLRVDWWDVGSSTRPGLATTVGVVAPSGRSTGGAHDPMGVDVTGRGQWALSAGVVVERTSMPNYMRLTVGGRFAFADRDGWRDGPALDVELAVGRELLPGWVVSAVVTESMRSERSYAGQTYAGSDGHVLRAALSTSMKLAPGWTLRGGLSAAPPAPSLGRNEPSDWAVTVGVRRGFDQD